jgi:hypothetical protein
MWQFRLRYRSALITTVFGACVWLLRTPDHVLAQGGDALLGEVRAAWGKRQATVRAVRVTWTQKDTRPKGSINLLMPEMVEPGEILPPADATHQGKGRLLIDGNESRIVTEEVTWDMPAKSFLAAFRGTDSNTMNRVDLGVFTLARNSTLGGTPMIEVVRERQEVRGEAKIWVDPAQDYAPRRFELYARDGNLQQRISINTRKDKSGLWVPTSWTAMVLDRSKLLRSVEVKVGELIINPATTPDDFRLDFPVGTKVLDSTGTDRREYIIRESDVREIPPKERGQKYEDLLRTEPGDLVPGAVPSFWVRNRLLWWGTGLVAIGGLLLLGRWRIRARGNGAGDSGNDPSAK